MPPTEQKGEGSAAFVQLHSVTDDKGVVFWIVFMFVFFSDVAHEGEREREKLERKKNVQAKKIREEKIIIHTNLDLVF